MPKGYGDTFVSHPCQNSLRFRHKCIESPETRHYMRRLVAGRGLGKNQSMPYASAASARVVRLLLGVALGRFGFLLCFEAVSRAARPFFWARAPGLAARSEEHTSELQSRENLV